MTGPAAGRRVVRPAGAAFVAAAVLAAVAFFAVVLAAVVFAAVVFAAVVFAAVCFAAAFFAAGAFFEAPAVGAGPGSSVVMVASAVFFRLVGWVCRRCGRSSVPAAEPGQRVQGDRQPVRPV